MRPKSAKALLAFTALTSPVAAYAQDKVTVSAEAPEEQADPANVPENVIIIQARRRSEAAQEVPLAIATLDARTLNDTGAFSVQKIQQLAPTLQVYSSNPRNTAVNIRGIGVPFGLTNDGFEQGVGIYMSCQTLAASPQATVIRLQKLSAAPRIHLRGPRSMNCESGMPTST